MVSPSRWLLLALSFQVPSKGLSAKAGKLSKSATPASKENLVFIVLPCSSEESLVHTPTSIASGDRPVQPLNAPSSSLMRHSLETHHDFDRWLLLRSSPLRDQSPTHGWEKLSLLALPQGIQRRRFGLRRGVA